MSVSCYAEPLGNHQHSFASEVPMGNASWSISLHFENLYLDAKNAVAYSVSFPLPLAKSMAPTLHVGENS